MTDAAPIATPGQVETTEAPKPLTAADVEALLEAKLSGYTSKINGELAGLRKAVKGETPAASAQPPRAATIEDIAASRELGRLEAQLGEGVLAALGEDYTSLSIVEQARMLRAISKLPKAETADASASRGETPAINPKNPRGEAPRPRDGVPRPQTKREYWALKPEQRKAVDADPMFDATTLPLR